MAFLNQPTKDDICKPFEESIYGAIAKTARDDKWWPGVRDHKVFPRLGTELDVLAVEEPDRLLAIEAKPAGAAQGHRLGPGAGAVLRGTLRVTRGLGAGLGRDHQQNVPATDRSRAHKR